MATKFSKKIAVTIDTQKKNLRFITVTLLMLKTAKINEKTFQFKTQCKGDISHAIETGKITAFDPTVCKTPDAIFFQNLVAMATLF